MIYGFETQTAWRKSSHPLLDGHSARVNRKERQQQAQHHQAERRQAGRNPARKGT